MPTRSARSVPTHARWLDGGAGQLLTGLARGATTQGRRAVPRSQGALTFACSGSMVAIHVMAAMLHTPISREPTNSMVYCFQQGILLLLALFLRLNGLRAGLASCPSPAAAGAPSSETGASVSAGSTGGCSGVGGDGGGEAIWRRRSPCAEGELGGRTTGGGRSCCSSSLSLSLAPRSPDATGDQEDDGSSEVPVAVVQRARTRCALGPKRR